MLKLHIIEPELQDQTGHSHGYVTSLIEANKDSLLFDLIIWHNVHGRDLFADQPCAIRPYFYRSIRRLQLLFCYCSIMRRGELIFVPTTERLDVMILDKLCGLLNYQKPIFLHFHQMYLTEKKQRALQQIAERRPNFIIMTPTSALQHMFKEMNFSYCYNVPCPSYISKPIIVPTRFSHVLYAGSMRKDKGFLLVIDVILATTQENIPFRVQCSLSASGKSDKDCNKSVQSLKSNHLKNVTLLSSTLEYKEYLENFSGAIVLLLYDVESYGNKFSGICLDALCQGAPVITFDGTWLSEVTKRFEAGIVINSSHIDAIKTAIFEVITNYNTYQNNCFKAAEVLRHEHHPIHTLKLIHELGLKLS